MKKLIFVSLLLGLVSCMTAEKHLEKFYDKGGSLEPVERLVTVHDTIPGADGKYSIIERLIEVPCPEPEPPKTKWMVRFDNKRFKDSLKHVRKMYNDSTSYVLDSMDIEVKMVKAENKGLKDSIKAMTPIVKSDNRKDRALSRHENFGFWDYFFWIIFFAGGFCVRHFFTIFKK
jgi:hypothetical protein